MIRSAIGTHAIIKAASFPQRLMVAAERHMRWTLAGRNSSVVGNVKQLGVLASHGVEPLACYSGVKDES